MGIAKRGPSDLSRLADSFNVIGNDKVRITTKERGMLLTEDYDVPADITTGMIPTAKTVGRITAWLVQHGMGPKSGDHLGRLREAQPMSLDFKEFKDSKPFIAYAPPRPYISLLAHTKLDPNTPAILPYSSYQKTIYLATPEGHTAPIVTTAYHYRTALLQDRPVSGDTLLFEDELINPSQLLEPADTKDRIRALYQHIRQNGTLIDTSNPDYSV